jgi:geranylgeranylglycerol-phosphate geranylgeranyltransferase
VGSAKDWALVVRPPIVIIAVAGASVGFLNATVGEGHPLPVVGWVINALAAALLAAGLMVHNDYYDLASDKVNRPHKVLAQGRIKERTARDVGFALMVVGVVVSFAGHPKATLAESFNVVAGLVALTVLADGLLYNTIGKKHGIGGHVEVAYGVALIPVFGAAGAGNTWLVLPLGLGLFVMEIGREIMVAGGDIEGDRKAGWVTLPVKVGMRKALIAALVFYLASLPLFLLPVITPGLVAWRPSLLYMVGSTAFVAGLVALWIPCWRRPEFATFERFIRTGSRLLVFTFELLLIAEAFV